MAQPKKAECRPRRPTRLEWRWGNRGTAAGSSARGRAGIPDEERGGGGIAKPVGPHTLLHCFASQLTEARYDIRSVQELPGYRDTSAIVLDAHLLHRSRRVARSLADCYIAEGFAGKGDPGSMMGGLLRRITPPGGSDGSTR